MADPGRDAERGRHRQPDVLSLFALAGVFVDQDPARARLLVGQRHAFHDRQGVGALDLGELSGALRMALGGVDFLLGGGEPFRAFEPGADGFDAVSAEDIQPVDVLTLLARQSDADLEAVMVREGEGAAACSPALNPRSSAGRSSSRSAAIVIRRVAGQGWNDLIPAVDRAAATTASPASI
jgi:hypothetical protein